MLSSLIFLYEDELSSPRGLWWMWLLQSAHPNRGGEHSV